MTRFSRLLGSALALGLIASSLQAGDDAAVILKRLKDRGAEVTCDKKGEVIEVKLIEPAFRNDDLATLRVFPSLRWLWLGRSFTEDGLKHLAGLDSLEVLFAQVMNISASGLKHLQGMKSLNYLGLRKDFMDEKGIRLLLKYGLAHKMQSVHGNGKLGRAASVDDVTDIQLGAWSLNADGLKVLKNFKSLSRITMEREQLNDGYVRSLRELNLLHIVYHSDGNNVRAKSNAEVTSLRLMTPTLTEKGFKEFAAFTSLRTLSLAETKLNDSALKTVASMKSLESLSLSPHMTDTGLKELPALPNLKILVLKSGFPITDSGMKAIAQIKNLEVLSVQDVSVTPAGIKNLKGLTLKTLGIFRHQITDDMLKVLHEMDLLHTINWAHGEKGRPTGLKDVRYLNLTGSKVTDAGLRELEGMTSLVKVFLEKTKVTDKGIANLKKALPKVQVSR